MAMLSVSRILQISASLGSQSRQMASVTNTASSVHLAARRMTTLVDHFSHSSGDERSRSSARTNRFSGTLFAATSATACAAYATASSPALTEESSPKTALDPNAFVKFKLKEKHALSHNTSIFRFELDPDTVLGLSVASCLLTKALIGEGGEAVIRPYTPISQPDEKGHFDLLIKVYPGGLMSNHIQNLEPGQELEVKGPILKLGVTPNMKRHIGMIAGGTGITPMLQVVEYILDNPEDNTQVSLVFANATPADILLKERIETIQAAHPNFKVFFLVDKPPAEGWMGGVGHITANVAKKALPPPADDTLILVCGPPGMMKFISGDKNPDKSQGELSGLLKDLGYTTEQVYKF